MRLTADQKSLIESIVNTYETGKPEGDYGAISLYADGPHGIRQITYGRSQTTEYGHLRELMEMYVHAGGLYGQELSPYLDLIGAQPLVEDSAFRSLLRKAGREDRVMREVQDRFFDTAYFQPAMAWADQNGFALPLSALVLYDSFIHSGSILWILRHRFPEAPPARGGNEKAWITQYVNVRHDWLGNHQNKILRKTTFRTADFKREIARDNWDLNRLPISANGTPVGER